MKKGKIAYNSLIRSVLRVPFMRRETEHVARDGVFHEGTSAGSSMNTVLMTGEKKEAYAFYRAYNSARCAGITPKELQLSLTLPVDFTEPETLELMRKMNALCSENGVRITGGHTAYSDSVLKPVMTLVLTGPVGMEARKPKEKDTIFLLGNVGEAGTELLYYAHKNTLKKRFSMGFLEGAVRDEKNLSVREMCALLENLPVTLHDVSEGGIFAALYEVSEGYKCGFTVDLKQMNIRQETVEICEVLELNPYTLLSTGALLVITEDREALLSRLENSGLTYAEIGTIMKGKQKIVKKGEEERFLERPQADAVYAADIFG